MMIFFLCAWLALQVSHDSCGMDNQYASFVDLHTIMYKHPINPNQQDKNGDTYLHRVMKNNKNPNIINKTKTALRRQSECITNFNVQNNENETILYLASGLPYGNDDISVVKTLVEHGADINIGKSCLAYALSKGNRAIAKFLLENGANPNISWFNIPNAFLLFAGNEEIFSLLMRYGSDPNISYNEMSLPALQRSLETHKPVADNDLKQRIKTFALRSIALMCECEWYAAETFIALSVILKRNKIKVPKVLLAEIVNRSLGHEMIARDENFFLKSRVTQETLALQGKNRYTVSQVCLCIMERYNLSDELKIVAPIWGELSELFHPEKTCINRMTIAKNIKNLMYSDYKKIDKKEETRFCLLG